MSGVVVDTLPFNVSTVMLPELTVGTTIVSDDVLAAVTSAARPLMKTLFFLITGSKFDPLIVTVPPVLLVVGEKLEMDGGVGTVTL
jgi:hypothetical protein